MLTNKYLAESYDFLFNFIMQSIFSSSWYKLCAGIHRKLALACALDKKIDHLNVATLYLQLATKTAISTWYNDKEIFHLNINTCPQLCNADNYFLLLGTCFVLIHKGN